MGRKLEVKPGDRYGLLTVVKEVDGRKRSNGDIRRMFFCQCDCGNSTVVPLDTLRAKRSPPACGCRRGYNGTGRTRHGYSRKLVRHPLYTVWSGMIGRCNTPTSGGYESYGGRGIRVCDEWIDAAEFIRWALLNGWRRGLQIDRIDNDGDYSPDNCRFVSASENQRNSRSNHLLTFNGKTLCLVEWAHELGISYGALNQRINIRKWPVERALTEPLRSSKKRIKQ